ncbi:MAG TPA: 30S ribosomal protein S6 [Dehalococcoidia bacterium]|nr:30S ribosomal protein S6 [Dehalococcoidia bacterium]
MARVPSRTARDYDLGIVINPEVGDEQARAIVERVTQTIAANGGQVIRVNAVGRRRLAYPIEHHRDGLYFFFDLTLPPTAVAEIERTLRVNEEIIRHLMLVRDPRLVADQRRREAEAEALAAQQAAERQAAAEAAAAQAAAAQAAAAAEAPAEAAPTEGGEVSGEEAQTAEANA